MRGTFFMGANSEPRFEVREMEFAPLAAHDVLVQVKACGVCGTDVHIYHGESCSTQVTPPVVLGHEFAGIVTEIGPAVSVVKPGDHVTLDPNIYCGECMPCRMGNKQNCEHLFALGVNVNGGFAEYALCPDTQCFRINDDIPFEEAAMAEPLACVVHGIDRADIHPGQTVLVIGGGMIGLMMAQLARLSGASAVILSEPIEMRRKIGLDVGIDAVIDPIHEDICTRLQSLIGKSGADVVIECVGKPLTLGQAIQAAGPHANVLMFSVPAADATASLPMFDIYQKELRICGSRINPDTHQRAVNLINSRRLKLANLITHRYDLEHLEAAIHMQMGSESIKVIVCPDKG